MHYTILEAYEVQPCELLIGKNKGVWYVVSQIKPGELAVQLPARSIMVVGSTACLPAQAANRHLMKAWQIIAGQGR